MISHRRRSHLEVAATVVALVFGTVLLLDAFRLYATYDGFGADVAVPLYTALPALAGAAWAAVARRGRRTALALGMLLPVGFLIQVGAPAPIFVGPLSVLSLLVLDRLHRLQPIG